MFHVAQGVSSPKANPDNWKNYGGPRFQVEGIVIDVDTSNCGFTSTPHYLVSIEGGKGFHWMISGLNSIYNATEKGFKMYLRWVDLPTEFSTIGLSEEPNPLTVKTAIDKEWSLKWTGIQVCPCEEKSS